MPVSSVYWEYLKTVELLGERCKLKDRKIILAFDYTDEEFYGDVETSYLDPQLDRGESRHWKVQIPNMCYGERHSQDSSVLHTCSHRLQPCKRCLSLIKPIVGPIDLILFDRGFYSKDLMLTLTRSEYPYLIFVPKNKKIKSELKAMIDEERKTIHYDFKVNKDKTNERGSTTLAFLKQIFDPKSERNFDWAFATDLEKVDLDHIIQTYKQRWRIETGFRIQDEARIKSKDVKIRFFYFVYEQVLQLIWNMIYREEVSFKRNLLNETSKERAEKAERKAKRSTRMA